MFRQVYSQDPCQQYYNNNSEYESQYLWIYILRRVFIGLSSLALIISMTMILRRKQYKFKTIRLFFWVQFFYLISLLSVGFHNKSFSLNQIAFDSNTSKFTQFMNCLVKSNHQYKCAVQGFINLSCYSISYWLAVCLTICIRYVLKDRKQFFYRQQGKLILLVILLIMIWFMVPTIMTFYQDVPFSFGPIGYKFKPQGPQYLLYSGIIPRGEEYQKYLVEFWMLFPTFLMFIYHIYNIWENRRYFRRLRQLQDQISPEKYFLIKSGELSFWIFGVQIMNVIKLILQFLSQSQTGLVYLVFALNSGFDLIALAFVIKYRACYYKEGNKIQQKLICTSQTLVTQTQK